MSKKFLNVLLMFLCFMTSTSQLNFTESHERGDGSFLPEDGSHHLSHYEGNYWETYLSRGNLLLNLDHENQIANLRALDYLNSNTLYWDNSLSQRYILQSDVLYLNENFSSPKKQIYAFKKTPILPQIYKESFYYINGNVLMNLNMATKKVTQELAPKLKLRNYVVYKNEIFYTTDALYKYDLNTGVHKKVNQIMPVIMEIRNGILFLLEQKNEQLCTLHQLDLHNSRSTWSKGPSIQGKINRNIQSIYALPPYRTLVFTENAYTIVDNTNQKILKNMSANIFSSNLNQSSDYIIMKEGAYYIDQGNLFYLDFITKKSTQTAIKNLSSILFEKDTFWLFDKQGNLWRSDKTLKKSEKVYSNKSLSNYVLQAINDAFLYCYKPLSLGQNFYELKIAPLEETAHTYSLSGSAHTALFSESDLIVAYTNDVIKYAADGSNSKILAQIFYSDIDQNQPITDIEIYGNNLYFASNGLYKMSLTGGEPKLIVEGNILEFDIQEGHLFYQDTLYDKTPRAYQIQLDGGEKHTLQLSSAEDIRYIFTLKGIYAIPKDNKNIKLIQWVK